MGRQITLGVVAVAALLAVLFAFHLWRSRRQGNEPWSKQDSFAVLGLLVAILGILIPPFVSGGGGSDEEPEVRAYRHSVASACRSLKSTTNPLMDALNDDGRFDRDKLIAGLRNQTRATAGVLDALWRKGVPKELAEEVRIAKAASRDFLIAAQEAFDRIEAEQPAAMSFQQLSAMSGILDAELRPPASEMESAMSRLADQPCASPIQSPSA